jgi:hypothetical protein
MNSKVTYIGSHPAVAIQDRPTRAGVSSASAASRWTCRPLGRPARLPSPDDWEVRRRSENAAAARKVEVEGLPRRPKQNADREAREQLPDEAEDVSTSGQADEPIIPE